MKIGIVGTGAMGSVYAGLLAKAGHDVWAVDSWAEHVEAMRRAGLRVEGASGDNTVALNATTDPAEAGVCEMVVIATKAMDAHAAAQAARPMVGRDSVVITIQNGLGSVEAVTEVLGSEQVAIGIVGGFGASMRGPGHAHHNGMEITHFGELDGAVTPRLERMAAAWTSAGFPAQCYDDISRMVWEKLICNVCFSATCALTGLTIGGVIADPGAWHVASNCAKEAFAVARAKGIAVAIDEPVAYVRAFGAMIPDARPSMLLDHQAGRPCEIDNINGAIPREAERVGLAALFNEAVTGLIKARERQFG